MYMCVDIVYKHIEGDSCGRAHKEVNHQIYTIFSELLSFVYKSGSVLIKGFCKVMKNECRNTDMADLLLKVIHLLFYMKFFTYICVCMSKCINIKMMF